MEKKLFLKNGISSVRAKLVSAVAMLLVATTMVVSSTYAWFTLSTAPEVSGITTAIGANGALEIRLNASENSRDQLKNHTYGNIVSLADNAVYGLDRIALLPSALALSQTDGFIDSRFLSIPQYGENGRLTEITAERTQTGLFNGEAFFADSNATGVRAVGVSSGLTDRQYAYRNAKYAATTNANLATTTAATSLNTNGGVLGGIVIKKATNSSPSFTKEEIEALGKIIGNLETSAGYIESAYEEMIVALAASAQVPIDNDLVYQTIRTNLINSNTWTLSDLVAGVDIDGKDGIDFTVTNEAFVAAITSLKETIGHIEDAQEAYDALADEGPYGWDDIRDIVYHVINTDGVSVCGVPVTSASTNMDTFQQAVMDYFMANGRIDVVLGDGSGVFVEIADHCGNFSSTITMSNVSVGSFSVDNVPAHMSTDSDQIPNHLANALAAVVAAKEPSGESSQEIPMTEFYGFIIDLGFKTNAANSNLLLQTTPVDRIYAENNNELTQGKGSYMTYKSTDSDFTTDQVKNLMDCIRIVFFDTTNNEIIGQARLDIANASTGADGAVTAMMYMYKAVERTEVKTDAEGNTVTETVTEYVLQNGEKDSGKDDASIIKLDQNIERKISVLVYLDGEDITNADVSATSAKSVTGSMNIQFASDANLVPMEYGDLHLTDKNASTGGNT